MLECKIEYLGPQTWVIQQMTNDGQSFALSIIFTKSVWKGFFSA